MPGGPTHSDLTAIRVELQRTIESLRERVDDLDRQATARGATVVQLEKRVTKRESEHEQLEKRVEKTEAIEGHLQVIREAVTPPPATTSETGLPSKRGGAGERLLTAATEHWRWTLAAVVLVVALVTGQPAAVVQAVLAALLGG